MEIVRDICTRTLFGIVAVQTWASEQLGLPAISTGRPFAFYRKVFFDERSEASVLAELDGKRVVDVGCGLTPFVPDSMFRACHDAGIDFFAVDPKLAEGFKFGSFDRLKVVFNNGARPDPNAPGEERRIASTADKLPFDDRSVDLVLSAWLLFVWLSEERALDSTFAEVKRVLKPGGTLRVYPTPRWNDSRLGTLPAEMFRGFAVQQRFIGGLDIVNLPPAYVTTFRKNG